MAQLTFDVLRKAILVRLGQAALDRARGSCPSKQLRESMQLVFPNALKVAVLVPHYWAPYFHDGRKAIEGKRMLFFKDRTDDPRTGHGTNYPVRVTDIKRFGKELPFIDKTELKRLRKAGKVIFTTRVGKQGGVPFFTNGLAGFGGTPAAEIVSATLDQFLAATVPSEFRVLKL